MQTLQQDFKDKIIRKHRSEYLCFPQIIANQNQSFSTTDISLTNAE